MIEHEFVVKNEMGLHIRPATVLVQKLNRFKSNIKIMRGNEIVDAKSIMGILTLSIRYGESIKFLIDGEDEQEALSVIKDLFENDFYVEQKSSYYSSKEKLNFQI